MQKAQQQLAQLPTTPAQAAAAATSAAGAGTQEGWNLRSLVRRIPYIGGASRAEYAAAIKAQQQQQLAQQQGTGPIAQGQQQYEIGEEVYDLGSNLERLQPGSSSSRIHEDVKGEGQRIKKTSPAVQFLCGSIAGCVAEAVTLPLDVSKVRQQLQQNSAVKPPTAIASNAVALAVANPPPKRGIISTVIFGKRGPPPMLSGLSTWSTIQEVVRTEGVGSLYKGLPPALMRQFMKAGLQMSLFKEFKMIICADPNKPSLAEQTAASVSAASFGQVIANPADMLKVRLMADGRRVAQGKQPKYHGMLHAAKRTFQEEGWRGFYKGTIPAVQRSALSSGGGLAVYAHMKQVLTDPKGSFAMENGTGTYLITSCISAMISTVISSPPDTIKTRLMNQGKTERQYNGWWDCAVKTVRAEGPLSLFKGIVPNFTRVVPWQMVFFVTYEGITSKVTGDTL